MISPVEDTGLLHVVFTDDTLLSLDTSWNRPDNYPVWGDAIMEIICENGRVLVDGFGRYADVYHNTGNQERVYYEPDMDIAMFTAFKDIIENDLPSPVAATQDDLPSKCLNLLINLSRQKNGV